MGHITYFGVLNPQQFKTGYESQINILQFQKCTQGKSKSKTQYT